MLGPGEYVGDVTEGITRVEDLPKAEVLVCRRSHPRLPCPRCRRLAHRINQVRRRLHDLGDLRIERPREVDLTYSWHHCPGCGACFHAELPIWVLPRSRYTRRVVSLAVRLVVEDGMPYRTASWHLWRDHRVFVPFATVQNWVEAGGKKGGAAHGGRLPAGSAQGVLRLHRRR